MITDIHCHVFPDRIARKAALSIGEFYGIPMQHDGTLDAMSYMPLLLVKDFDAHGPVRSDGSFMTNADVPSLAMAGLIEAPTDPHSGLPVDMSPKEGTLYISTSRAWDIRENNGNVFLPAPWLAVHGSSLEESNWELDAQPPAG